MSEMNTTAGPLDKEVMVQHEVLANNVAVARLGGHNGIVAALAAHRAA